MKGTLTLIPTPIDDISLLEPTATQKLHSAVDSKDLIFVEEAKAGRRRWLHYGLPREAIENFVLYNEHTFKEAGDQAVAALKSGKNVFLMSDCGLPAFCDPGRRLVERCHYSKIKVTSTPFPNSISLAIALSGFPHERFVFEGFIPVNSANRAKAIKRIMNSSDVSVLMDTPYRLKKMLEELAAIDSEREAFIGLDLNHESEELFRDKLSKLNNKIDKSKREFVLVLGPKR